MNNDPVSLDPTCPSRKLDPAGGVVWADVSYRSIGDAEKPRIYGAVYAVGTVSQFRVALRRRSSTRHGRGECAGTSCRAHVPPGSSPFRSTA